VPSCSPRRRSSRSGWRWRAPEAHEKIVVAGCRPGGAEPKPTTTATTLRIRNGKTTLTDGPFAEAKEALGGCTVIDVASLDEATCWASRGPAPGSGSIEVRPATRLHATAASAEATDWKQYQASYGKPT
jgi:hypothetical protein